MTFFDLTDAGQIGADVAHGAPAAAHTRVAVWTWRRFAVAVACLFATCAIAFTRWQIDGTVVPWDSKNHFYPMFRFLADALHHGTVPFWNPYHFGGYPAVADPQSLIFTPSMVLFALVAPQASMPVFDAVILTHLFVGGVGMLGLARRWQWHPAGAFLAALVFILGGAASARLQHTGMIISYSWFPPALWALEVALDRRSLRLALGTGVLIALMALGRDQVAYLLCLTLAGAVCWKAAQAPNALRYLAERTPVLAVVAFATIALMIVPILLTMQFIHESNRPSFAYGRALEGSLNPANLATLISPNLFGSLDRIYNYWGPGLIESRGADITDRSMDYLFVGTLPVVLILWHGLAGGRLFERNVRFAGALVVLTLLYALGRHTPFFSLVFDWLPAVSLYRRPADATFVLNIALAMSGGYLVSRFVESGLPQMRRPRTWGLILVTLAGTAFIVGSGLAFADGAGHLAQSLIALGWSIGLTLTVAGLLYWFGRVERYRAMLAVALVAATTGQLLWRNSDSALNAERTGIYDVYQTLPTDEARGLKLLQDEIADRVTKGEYPRVEIFGLTGAWQNASMVLKLQDTLGYNPLRIDWYEKAVGATENSTNLMKREFPGTFRGYNSRLASLLGLDYLILDCTIDDLPRQIPRPRADLMFAGRDFYIYRLTGKKTPRAYLATKVQSVDSRAVIDSGMMPSFNIGTEALIDAKDVVKLKSLKTSDNGPDAATSHVQIASYADNVVRLNVDASATGVLVLHDIAYSGWSATVDGRPMPVLRANLLFRGVEVSPGHHVVEFAFRPLSPNNLMAAASGLLHKGGP